MPSVQRFNVVVVGGGAAGFFAAIRCAEANPKATVVILEKSREVLQKVKVSGGGRCNVTYACFDPKELVGNYPRGSKALLGPFHHFQPCDTIAWFEAHGVALTTAADGRMFPVSNRSQTIVDCLISAAQEAGVKVCTGQDVTDIVSPGTATTRWVVKTHAGQIFEAEKLMVATGSSSRIWSLLQKLGHTIVPPVPSLFTFNINDARIGHLPGISVPDAQVGISGTSLEECGPLLITHWGLSGPAILKLSAQGARILAGLNYKFQIEVNWLGGLMPGDFDEIVRRTRQAHGKNTLGRQCPFPLPARLWKSLVEACGIPLNWRWADLQKEQQHQLCGQLLACRFAVGGKSTFKEEFVTAGGVSLDEVNFRRFESRIHRGLHLAGEVLDIDALTGGFNFQAAWTGGWLAGCAMGEEQ